MTREKLVYKNNGKISDKDFVDFFRELEDIYGTCLREKEKKAVRDLLLLNEIYNSMMEIKRVLRVRKIAFDEE